MKLARYRLVVLAVSATKGKVKKNHLSPGVERQPRRGKRGKGEEEGRREEEDSIIVTTTSKC